MVNRTLAFKFNKLTVKNYEIVNAHSGQLSTSNITAIGEGGSGIVFKAQQTLHGDVRIDRAIKFFMYRDDIADLTKHKHEGPISISDFLAEIKNISAFSHQNLLSVIDAGIHEQEGLNIPYIVTDFVDGPTLRQVLSNDLNIKDGKYMNEARKQKQDIVDNPHLALDILLQIGSAIQQLHINQLYHCDIAPKNIFLSSKNTITPILGDLGIAKDFRLEREEVFVAGSKSYAPDQVVRFMNKDVKWDQFKALQPYWDMYGFSKTGIELLDLVSGAGQDWIKPLRATFEKIVASDEQQIDIHQLLDRIEFLQPFHRELAKVPELSPGLTGKRRNLMPIESLSVSRRIQRLISHPSLLRLGDVPQLTMTNQLFPGANHTRYEHSLGVMETVRRYLSALLDQHPFLTHLSVEKIETALLCSLLSCITRFPLSNVFHEIKSRNKEELGLFSREHLLSDIEKFTNKRGETMTEIIEAEFPSVSYICVKNILLEKMDQFDDEDRLIHSFLHSSLDARVIDFVRRDSLHLGIIKGDVFSLDELLPHFTIHNHKLALKVTGVSIAEQIISLRYWLFQRIYWNSPNRKYCAMIRHVILDLSENSKFEKSFRRAVLINNQNELVKFLVSYAKRNKMAASLDICERLVRKDQDLYRTLLDVGQTDRSDLVSVCRKITQMNFREIQDLESKVEAQIAPLLNGYTTRQLPIKLILIDVPHEPGENKLGDDIVVIKHDSSISNLRDFSGIVGGINQSFDTQLKRLRIFIHPDYYSYETELEQKLKASVLKCLNDYVS